MKTYIKIYGPPLLEALDALQKIAATMPDLKHYHLLSNYGSVPDYPFSTGTDLGGHQTYERTEARTSSLGMLSVPANPVVSIEATHPMFSRSGHTLGEYDFFFEWRDEHTWEEMRELIMKIDKALAPLGCKYTLTNK